MAGITVDQAQKLFAAYNNINFTTAKEFVDYVFGVGNRTITGDLTVTGNLDVDGDTDFEGANNNFTGHIVALDVSTITDVITGGNLIAQGGDVIADNNLHVFGTTVADGLIISNNGISMAATAGIFFGIGKQIIATGIDWNIRNTTIGGSLNLSAHRLLCNNSTFGIFNAPDVIQQVVSPIIFGVDVNPNVTDLQTVVNSLRTGLKNYGIFV